MIASPKKPSIYLTILSQILGYTSIFFWFFTFIFIIYEIRKTSSFQGVSYNFILLNILGFSYYSIYNFWGMYGDSSFKNQVHSSDFFFGLYCLFMNFVLLAFGCFYPSKNNRLSLLWVLTALSSVGNLSIPLYTLLTYSHASYKTTTLQRLP